MNQAFDSGNTSRQPKRNCPIFSDVTVVKEIKKAEEVVYFDTLAQDALENLLRWLSGRPRDEKWAAFIEVDDLSMVMHVDGDLGTLARTQFSGVFIGDPLYHSNQELTEPGMLSMRSAGDARMLHPQAWKSLKTLVIDSGVKQFKRLDSLDIFSSLATYVTRMDVSSDHGAWVARFGREIAHT